jgi:hypothetical protein
VSEDSQILVPASFLALYVAPGRIRPSATRQEIAERYEFCEDLANMLVEQAKAVLFDLGVAEEDVLERIHAGLCSADAGVNAAQAWWVTRRLAELLGWEWFRTAPAEDAGA